MNINYYDNIKFHEIPCIRSQATLAIKFITHVLTDTHFPTTLSAWIEISSSQFVPLAPNIFLLVVIMFHLVTVSKLYKICTHMHISINNVRYKSSAFFINAKLIIHTRIIIFWKFSFVIQYNKTKFRKNIYSGINR